MVGVAVEKSVKSIPDSDTCPAVVAFFSEASSSAKSSSSDLRPLAVDGMDDVAVDGGVANIAAIDAAGGADGVLGAAMVMPSSTKSSEPDDGPDGAAAAGGDARPGAVGVSSDA